LVREDKIDHQEPKAAGAAETHDRRYMSTKWRAVVVAKSAARAQ
jgi:hypothetical protein